MHPVCGCVQAAQEAQAAAAEAAAAGVEQVQLDDAAVADGNGAASFFEQELPAANPEEFFDNLAPADLPTPAAPAAPAVEAPKAAAAVSACTCSACSTAAEQCLILALASHLLLHVPALCCSIPASMLSTKQLCCLAPQQEEAPAAVKPAENEEEIQRALFVGNYDAAVEACFKASRMADALLIANIGGPELYKRAMSRYMRKQPRPYMQVRTLLASSPSYVTQCQALAAVLHDVRCSRVPGQPSQPCITKPRHHVLGRVHLCCYC
jgi:hypothetical protein